MDLVSLAVFGAAWTCKIIFKKYLTMPIYVKLSRKYQKGLGFLLRVSCLASYAVGTTPNLVCPPGVTPNLVCPPGFTPNLVCPPG